MKIADIISEELKSKLTYAAIIQEQLNEDRKVEEENKHIVFISKDDLDNGELPELVYEPFDQMELDFEWDVH